MATRRQTQTKKAGADPKPVLKDDVLYSGDNGRLFCGRCAGMSARYTGRDLSGQKVAVFRVGDVAAWLKEMPRYGGSPKPPACEGCRRVLHPCQRVVTATTQDDRFARAVKLCFKTEGYEKGMMIGPLWYVDANGKCVPVAPSTEPMFDGSESAEWTSYAEALKFASATGLRLEEV